MAKTAPRSSPYKGSMRIIVYAGHEWLTGNDIADALLEYSRALGDDDRAEIVEIPVRNDSGEVVSAKFLIGPASQIVSQAAEGRGPEVVDTELVARLQQRAQQVVSPSSAPMSAADVVSFDRHGTV